MIRHALTLTTLALAALVAAAPVAAADDVCVTFSDARQTARFGSQYLLVRDGDKHYRVSFVDHQCGAMALVGKIRLETKDANNVLCQREGRVKTRHGSCRVKQVDEIDAATFARLTRAR
jgi:hypothetical protein